MNPMLMTRSVLLTWLWILFLIAACSPTDEAEMDETAPDTLRIATYNIEDVRTGDLQNADHPRLQKAAAIIQRVRPDILLVNEITYDAPNGQNAQRFADAFLNVSQGEGLEPIRYQVFTAPTNTGLASGFDLNNDGVLVDTFPTPAPPNPDGSPLSQTQAQRDYGNDTWGFGTFPGQYGMALFVREGLDILRDSVRTFQLLPWSQMPDALMPVDAAGQSWYEGEEGARFRLSSKSHWDVPVRLPNGSMLHVLASHPTPPAFDGPEQRNVRRNHDEIRFWADYLNGAAYIVDDADQSGGLPADAPFVIMGDQNADPDEGASFNDPIGTFLLSHPRINGEVVPRATPEGIDAYPDLDPDDTAAWGLRVDYVLPSTHLRVLDSGIVRPVGADTSGVQVSDHFPVWIEVAVDAQ